MPKPPKQKSCKVFVGIDPGIGGGLVAISSVGIVVTPMPVTERDIWDWFAAIPPERSMAVLEKVHSMPGQGVASMFKFGQSYGFLRACLIGRGIPFEEIMPRIWVRAIGVPPKKKSESRSQWKNRLKGKAQQLFPDIASEITLITADALLIAEVCRRKHREK